MRETNRIKQIKKMYISFSIVLILLGLLLLIRPEIASLIFFRIGGVVLILFGIVKLIGYFSKDLLQLAFQFDFALGILSTIAGIVLLFLTKEFVQVLSIGFGLVMVINALFKIQTAIDAKRIGVELWWIILVMAICVAIIGLLLFFKPFEGAMIAVRLIGINLIIDGGLNVIVVINTVDTIRRRREWAD